MRITEKLKKQFENKAKELCAEYNPYIKNCIEYAIDGSPRYLYGDVSLTKEQIDAEYIKTASKDIQKGYEERMVGYYDKWYRYSRSDEGCAYDAGQRIASSSPKCPEHFNIIEIAECNK